jgi:hypothetical protein
MAHAVGRRDAGGAEVVGVDTDFSLSCEAGSEISLWLYGRRTVRLR